MNRILPKLLLAAVLVLLLTLPAQAAMPFIQVHHDWVVELEFVQIRSRPCRFGLRETDRLAGEIQQEIVGRQTICYLSYTSVTLPFSLHQLFVFLLVSIVALFLHQSRTSRPPSPSANRASAK